MARRTKEEAAATRELLLDTAETVFLERGVSRASLQDIASAAGVTRGAIYWHFKDKAELFNAMMDRAIMPCETPDDDDADGAGPPACPGAPPSADDLDDPLDALRRMVLRPLERLRDDERTRRVFTVAIHRTEYTDEMRIARDRHEEAIGRYTAGLALRLDLARSRGLIRADVDIDTAARALFALTDGLLRRYTLHPDPTEGVKTAETGVAWLLAGMKA